MSQVPTIADVLREERLTIAAAMEKFQMEDVGELRDHKKHTPCFIWLGGFGRFAEVAGVTSDWWVREPRAFGNSWCCTPCTRIYKRKAVQP